MTSKTAILRPVVQARRLVNRAARSSKMVSRHVVRGTILSLTPQFITTFVVDHNPMTPPEVLYVLQDTLVTSMMTGLVGVVMTIK